MKVDLLDTPSQDVRLEIIPLIDVIFCILTFFILAAVGLTRQQAIDLDLPTAQTGQALPGQVGEGADRLYVSVDGLGQIYLDQQPVTLDLLTDVLLQFNQVNPGGLIVLYASRDARYEDVVTVLDQLRAVGGDRVALATLPSDTTLGPGETEPGLEDPTILPDGFPNGLPQDVPGGQGLPPGFEQPGGDPFAPQSPLFPSEPTSPLQPAPSPNPQPDN
ncbi:biopolymer transporter ExbD [Nodosilinea sp. LEGE 06152]|uniref:ExbD/TolR family protein n=1 Tax=Nodosilinea sp. LEGE 06152 TaxID=2777966 RepID=UPI00188093E5|nr:biopolymer transporter ExbD [Nodosilinea sp. LEGE 06152]MBE9156764.1 biopolymer transporter ExbD [Nodosilinea sp. LEGE 06152]